MNETMTTPDLSSLACPIPITDYPTVLLAHGGGGKLSQQLIDRMFIGPFANDALSELHDGAQLAVGQHRVAMSTDSFVVSPMFFPGGDIGSLAVHGTVNDISMCGATPIALSAGFILEEGLPMETLWKVVQSMQAAAAAAGVRLVTGDTKVVDRGKGDGIYINTTGLGLIPDGVDIRPTRATDGDVVIVSGPIAAHGIAIMSLREGLEFETAVQSDSAALNGLVRTMLSVTKDIHVLRDPTRGGVASALNEIARSAMIGITLEQQAIPIAEEVSGACEILGLDPLYVANEGILIAIVPELSAKKLVDAMRADARGRQSAIIGRVTTKNKGIVTMKTRVGGTRVVDMLSGEQLPRIC